MKIFGFSFQTFLYIEIEKQHKITAHFIDDPLIETKYFNIAIYECSTWCNRLNWNITCLHVLGTSDLETNTETVSSNEIAVTDQSQELKITNRSKLVTNSVTSWGVEFYQKIWKISSNLDLTLCFWSKTFHLKLIILHSITICKCVSRLSGFWTTS